MLDLSSNAKNHIAHSNIVEKALTVMIMVLLMILFGYS